ncbi:acyl-CoA dehydrogenase [Actinosynnema sp. NPDC023587]|uniref:acyl-CoA dehydrogenase family protein n=1 Tax=Actinosynnema sp. NPDC023587 TaxID=3154695 RepID=UPI0033C27BC2
MPSDDEFREVLAALSRHELFRPRDGLDYRRRCELTYDRLRVVGEHLPPGSALLRDLPRLFTALEWAAVADPPLFLALTLHVCLSLGAIVEFGGDGAERHVRELDAMSSFGALLVTEVGRGNSHLGIRTVAEHDPATGGFRLRTPDEAARKFMPNVGLANVPKIGVVYARLHAHGRDHGVFPFVTPIRTADGTPDGVHVTPLPEAPLLPLDYAVISFDDLLLPPAALLSDTARLDAAGTLDDPLGDPERRLRRSLDIRHNAWVASAAALAAVTRAGVVNALRHARTRTTVSPFTAERAVLDHRAHQRPLFAALADCYALTRVVDKVKAARIRSQGRESAGDDGSWLSEPALNRTYGLVKAYASDAAGRIVTECGLRCGAHGMFTPGRWVEYQGLAHMLGPAAGDGYLIVLEAARAMASGDHYAPPPPEDRAAGDPLDPASWPVLARTRERLLHQRLVERMELARGRGQTGFEAWNNRASSGVEFVEAHVARLVLEAVAEVPAQARTGPAARLADALHALHAVRELTAHAGFHLREGLLTGEQVDRLAGRDNELCDRVLADLGAVPHLLDVPEEFRHPALSP